MKPPLATVPALLALSVVFWFVVIIYSMAGCQTARGAVTERFLDALERVESQGCATAIGDNGKARGPFQFWAVAWSDATRERRRSGNTVAPFETGAHDRAIARSYARTYLGMLHQQLTPALGRKPNPAELYACWNLGFHSLRRRGFSLAKCPAATQRNASIISSANISGGRKPRNAS